MEETLIYNDYDIYKINSLENIKSAEMLFQNSLFNASANRAYYSAFQLAIWALKKNGILIDNASHQNVHSIFSRELINRRKIYSPSIKSYLLDLLDKRITADYSNKLLSKEKSKKQLNIANEFIKNILGDIYE